ncbi:transcriptional regulator [Tychonema sp. LEGE 07199]|uniref:helix-turn-helix domain-containing transcriptional regulator n=1 Tax=unclassified Tychonema TaxID=2642144 RepID=UPI00187EC081|nr:MULTISPECIES: transcriptional regulator [unclassified Tychonema]MBE9120678.1 transcriptional regulator [Tychonema sp. LEGE 07199]MBE9132588.1 transcriptional regulator [Tychonema sp. LEGE 07196]
MKNVKAPTSRSYQEFLIESLRNAQEAAGYIEVTLTEASDEPKLLQMVLKDIVDSRLKFHNLSESAQIQWEKLDKMLTASAGAEIYCFVELLEALGFKLGITVEESELRVDSESTNIEESELSPEPANL